jgi:hypothetical protein
MARRRKNAVVPMRLTIVSCRQTAESPLDGQNQREPISGRRDVVTRAINVKAASVSIIEGRISGLEVTSLF